MSEIILDASALLAMIRREPGGDKVGRSIVGARMSAVNYAEVVSHFVQNEMPPHQVNAMLIPLPVDIVEVDRDLAELAGGLRSKTMEAGLSLGDRFCLALALRDSVPAWTADRQWRSIADKVGVNVVLIR